MVSFIIRNKSSFNLTFAFKPYTIHLTLIYYTLSYCRDFVPPQLFFHNSTMIITWNIPSLVKHTNITDSFLSRLLESGLITVEALEHLKNTNNSSQFPYSIFREIDKRLGTDVVEKLVVVLLETDNIEAARVLSPGRVREFLNRDRSLNKQNLENIATEFTERSNNNPDGCVPSKSSIHNNGEYCVQEDSFSIKVEPATKVIRGKNIYPIGPGVLRGQVLIINNENFQQLATRTGSQVDVANLQTLFTKLGFLVDVKENLTKRDTLDLLIHFFENKGHITGHVLIFVVLSHGEEGGIIFTHDDKTVDINVDILR